MDNLYQNASLVRNVPNKPDHLFMFNLMNGKEPDDPEPNGKGRRFFMSDRDIERF